MKCVNKVIILGNSVRDPELKYTPSGTAVASFSVATNERYKDKSGAWADRTEFHNVKAWQRLAEIVGEYVKKGSKLFIEGRLTTESWEKGGEKRSKTVVTATEIVLLDGRDGSAKPAEQARPRHMSDEEVAASLEITDEDIPF